MISRRDMMKAGAVVVGGAAMLHKSTTPARAAETPAPTRSRWNKTYSGGSVDREPLPPGLPGKDYTPVHVPNGATLAFKIVDGVKVFHLIAEEIEHEFAPGLKARCWGYNGHVNGTVIEAVEGERVRIYVTNKLPAPTTVHWHGVYLPNGMDGVSALTQRPIPPGDTFKYEWTIRQNGTYMYHSHYDTMTQEGMGLIGMLILHPRNPTPDDRVDRDFAVMLSEWRIDPGTSRPNTNEMTDFNILTMNGKCFPGIHPMVTQTNDRVRIRFGNLSAMDHHPMHMHGYYFKITATDGERIPLSAQWPETTVLMAVGQTRDIELITDAPGDWAFHCHMTHHVMNQMGHDFPNMIGAHFGDLDDRIAKLLPDYMTMGETGMGEHGKHISMGHMRPPKNSIPMVGAQLAFGYSGVGGMFTVLKVRDEVQGHDDPGWYEHPKGTVAEVASHEQLQRDLGSIPS